jgi:prevent-host-death family protein
MQPVPISVPLSEFRANTSAMIDLVEKGETVRILRHGKPVAELVPMQPEAVQKVPSWKQPFEPVVLSAGASLSQAVLNERSEAPW